MKLFLIALMGFLLVGCGIVPALTGNASYDFERKLANGDKCHLHVDSGRELTAGVELEISDTCGLKAKAQNVTQGGSALDVNAALRDLKDIANGRAAPEPLPTASAALFPVPPDD